jgi:hypothetical protein
MAKEVLREKGPTGSQAEIGTRTLSRRFAGANFGSSTKFLLVFSLSIWQAAGVIVGTT